MQDPWAAITSAATALEQGARRDGMQVGRSKVFGVDSLVCRAAPIGKLTRLHPFMVVGVFPPGWATLDLVTSFMDAAVELSIGAKGGLPRGAQTGTATIGVVLTDHLAPDAAGWASKQRRTRFAAVGYPVTVELATGRVAHPQRMVVGAVYSKPLRRFVADHVTAVLGAGRG